ncbi:VanZ family protein [bacterium]|nr:VanZ family protein [bacterium]
MIEEPPERAPGQLDESEKRRGGALFLWWAIACLAIVTLYTSAPYVREMQVALREALQEHFDLIFKSTVVLLAICLVVSGAWVQLRRTVERGSSDGNRRRRVLKALLVKPALSCLVALLYWVGLYYVICTNPAKGVRIIEFIHLFEYTLITILVLKAVSRTVSGPRAYILAFLIMYLVGLGDEAIQGYIARRVGEFRDVRINAVVSGLALLSVWLVFSPSGLAGKINRGQIRRILPIGAACILATAAFISAIHVGYRIEDKSCGVFYSLFSKDELLDRAQKANIGPALPKRELPKSTNGIDYWAPEDFYRTESRKHRIERDIFLREGRFWEAFCEEKIRRVYYTRFADWERWGGWTESMMRKRFGPFDTSSFQSYHHDLVFRGFEHWSVWVAAAVACIGLYVVGILFQNNKG